MIFLGLFVISTALLALQILQTRIFSFTLWHHMAYMVITIALMGMSTGGTWLAIRKKEIKRPWLFITVLSLLFTATTIISLVIVTRIPLDTYMADRSLQLIYVFQYYLALIFPYFFVGIIISFIFREIRGRINLYYLSNLIGSAIGGFLILPVMESLGGEATVLVIAGTGSIAALLFAWKGGHRKMAAVSIISLFLLFLLYPLRFELFTIISPPSKALGMGYLYDKEQKIEYTNWDRVARIDVFSNSRSQEFFNYFPELKNKIITIDGDAYTVLYDFPSVIKDSYKDYAPIGESLYSSAYFVHEKPKVLIVGLGGGTDIITALYHDAPSITGIEINKAMIDVTKNQFASYVGSPYQDPRVNIIHSEGRSFIRRTPEKYDIIQMSGVDTWTALSTGAYVMSESYIYTSDAIKEYLSKLSPDGTLSIIRWLFWPPREMLRLCSEAVYVLRSMGIERPEDHIAIIGDGSLAAILIKLRPFTWYEIASLDAATLGTKKNRIIYAPGFSASPEYYAPIFTIYPFSLDQGMTYLSSSFDDFFKAVAENNETAFVKNYDYDITPVTDDNPFFFKYYKWSHLFSPTKSTGGALTDQFPVGLAILLFSLVQALIFSLILIVLPLFFIRKKQKTYSPFSQIAYFSLIGIGFMFIEISLIQQFVLFLGNPSDAIAVSIMILLFFTGIGALFSKKLLILLGDKRFYTLLALFFPLVIIAYAYLLPEITHYYLASPYSSRVLVSFFLLAPLGFFLGQFFPTGLLIVGEKNANFIPWAYAINGVASVVSSILSIIIAMAYGFTFVFVIAAFCYLFAAYIFYHFCRKYG